MLPYKNRLINKSDFEKVYRFGAFFSFNNIYLKVRENKGTETRVGFSVGIKFSKKAVERNRLKRQLRAIVGKNKENIKKGWDIVIMVKKEGKTKLDSRELEKNVIGVLKKSNLI
jgi:ribonuclease P protein component